MAISTWTRIHFPYVATCEEIHRYWKINQTKTPFKKGEFVAFNQQHYNMKLKIYKYFLIIPIIFLFAPQITNATTLFQQPIYDTYGGNSLSYTQYLGTGHTGILKKIYLKYAVGTKTAGAAIMQLQLRCYSNIEYTTPVDCENGSTFGDSLISDDYYNQLTQDGNISTVEITFTTEETAHSAELNLNENVYYRISGYNAPVYATEYMYGTSEGSSCTGSACTGLGSLYYIATDENGMTPDDTTTKIETTTPYNEETTATSTTFAVGATGYINDNEFEENTSIDIVLENRAYNSSQIAVASLWNGSSLMINKRFVFPITESGAFDVATTTEIEQIGQYNMLTKITQPQISFWGFNFGTNTIVSTSTSFIVATSTEYDLIANEISDSINQMLLNTGSFSCEFDFTSLFSFDNLKNCVKFLFVPDMTSISEATNDVKTLVLTSFPLGYLMDFMEITSSTATSTMPVINATIPSALGIGENHNIQLDLTGVFDYVLNSDGGEFRTATSTLYEVTNEYWKIFVYLSAFFYMLSRIIPRFNLSINQFN